MNDGIRNDRTLPAPNRSAALRGKWVSRLTLCMGALVAALAVVVDDSHAPASAASRAPAARDNDRTLKLDLIDRLKSSPETLILGSSRAKQAEPAQLRELTGRSGFNAGVTGGTAADAWVMTRYVADCFPRHKRRYLWFVDVGIATNGINPDLKADPRSQKYLDSTDGSPVAGRVCGPGDRTTSSRYKADGSYVRRSRLPERGRKFDKALAEAIAYVRASRGQSFNTDPRRLVWFEKTLAFMNRQGARPVIVLNPIHPAVLAELRKYGFPARRAAAVDLGRLHERFDFVVVDAEDVRRWGGSPDGFWGVAHIDSANMRRLLPYVVKHSRGALR